MAHRTVVTLLLVLSAVVLASVGALIVAERHHASQTRVTPSRDLVPCRRLSRRLK